MHKIILDTNFLLTSLKYKIDIFSEISRICHFPYTISIVDKTIDELKGKKQENLALELIKKINIIKTEKNKNTDNLILELKEKNLIVATQDKELKKKLKNKKIPIITIRQKKYLILK